MVHIKLCVFLSKKIIKFAKILPQKELCFQTEKSLEKSTLNPVKDIIRRESVQKLLRLSMGRNFKDADPPEL
jgi:hypothetical protein